MRPALVALAAGVVFVLSGCADGGDETGRERSYSELPQVCELVPRATVDVLVNPAALPGAEGTEETTTCTWTYTPSEVPTGVGPQPYRRKLEVAVTRYDAKEGQTGSYWATKTFEQLRDDPGMGQNEPVTGIGDAAYRWFGKYGVDEAGVEFRRANLTVRVTYGGSDVEPSGESKDIAESVAMDGALTAAREVDQALAEAN